MKCDPALINRLKRANGQMKGVITMMESDKSCGDIVAQLKAVRTSIDKAIGLVTTQNLLQTMQHDLDVDLPEIKHAINLIIKGK